MDITKYSDNTDDKPEEERAASSSPLPDTPPAELVDQRLPPVKQRVEIAPNEDNCDIRTGDLIVQAFDNPEITLKYYAELVLAKYGKREVIGLCLHNGNYVEHDLERWLSCYGNVSYDQDGVCEGPAGAAPMRVYKAVAPTMDEESSHDA